MPKHHHHNPATSPLYPYFGAKWQIMPLIWQLIGDPDNLIDPFAGSLATILSRPHWNWSTNNWINQKHRTETINDIDGFITNLWRSIQSDPITTAIYASQPVNEINLHAYHLYLKSIKNHLPNLLMANPSYYNPLIAGIWLNIISQWIGGRLIEAPGPWTSLNGYLIPINQLPSSINPTTIPTIKRQLPHLSSKGMGIHKPIPTNIYYPIIPQYLNHLISLMSSYQNRLRLTRITCGDWSRLTSPNITYNHPGITAIILDPPYPSHSNRHNTLYSIDNTTISNQAYNWAISNANNPKLRIIFCTYENSYTFPPDWSSYPWSSRGGYNNISKSNLNRHREIIYASPHCLTPSSPKLL